MNISNLFDDFFGLRRLEDLVAQNTKHVNSLIDQSYRLSEDIATLQIMERVSSLKCLEDMLKQQSETIAKINQKINVFTDKFMTIENSIARLIALSEKIDAAVSAEAAQLEDKLAERDRAIAEKNKTISELQQALSQVVSASHDPILKASLDAAFSKLEAAVDRISNIVKDVNLTPIADVIVESVQEDNAPTPEVLVDVVVTSTTPTPGADIAADAIVEAVGEVEEATRKN